MQCSRTLLSFTFRTLGMPPWPASGFGKGSGNTLLPWRHSIPQPGGRQQASDMKSDGSARPDYRVVCCCTADRTLATPDRTITGNSSTVTCRAQKVGLLPKSADLNRFVKRRAFWEVLLSLLVHVTTKKNIKVLFHVLPK